MATQMRLALRPDEAREINETVSVLERGGSVAYFGAGVPLFMHRAADEVGRRLATAQVIELGLASQAEVSEALKIDRTTLFHSLYSTKKDVRESSKK